MNELLQLKGQFEQAKRNGAFGPVTIPSGATVRAKHLARLIDSLKAAEHYWDNQHVISNVLINVEYRTVVAKSNRIDSLLETKETRPNDAIVGARFTNETDPRHVITYCVTPQALRSTIEKLEAAYAITNQEFIGGVTHDALNSLQGKNKTRELKSDALKPSVFAKIIRDAYCVDDFSVQAAIDISEEESLITLYEVNEDITAVLRKLGIGVDASIGSGGNTFLLEPLQVGRLKDEAPYLIAMATEDLSLLTLEDCDPYPVREQITIPDPTTEPVIGVIDTLFDESVYFSKWVKFENYVDPALGYDQQDYVHGTAVSSIIVDGPTSNPKLEDGCGRFRVRHFGVSKAGKFSTFRIIRNIERIVKRNPDIRVWNLSLGSPVEVHPNFISYAAAMLDRLQYENDVIFVIAGTNKPADDPVLERIGSPADSLNGVSVNAVDANGAPAPYSRSGPILSFFNKPDLSCFGGVDSDRIQVCTPTGVSYVSGTSFAAPWIARKLAYLIHVMGFSREVAKALLIDSAAGWAPQVHSAQLIGFGVVPTHIKDVIGSKDDEIKFVLFGVSEAYNTYTYNLPIPVTKGIHPFKAMATLCYFPKCDRNQGVDYTNTELNIQFGRMKDGHIKPIDNNTQGDEGWRRLYEKDVRKHFRKWDNTKHIGEVLSGQKRGVKSYGVFWGLSIKSASRLNTGDSRNMPFGVVVRLKEVTGKNRIDEFVEQCTARGWLVERIHLDNRLTVFEKSDEEIAFEDE